jgi:hypothetical protein
LSIVVDDDAVVVFDEDDGDFEVICWVYTSNINPFLILLIKRTTKSNQDQNTSLAVFLLVFFVVVADCSSIPCVAFASNIEKNINHRIQQVKDKMKKTNQRIETDRLWIRIETLQWALAQILALRG